MSASQRSRYRLVSDSLSPNALPTPSLSVPTSAIPQRKLQNDIKHHKLDLPTNNREAGTRKSILTRAKVSRAELEYVKSTGDNALRTVLKPRTILQDVTNSVTSAKTEATPDPSLRKTREPSLAQNKQAPSIPWKEGIMKSKIDSKSANGNNIVTTQLSTPPPELRRPRTTKEPGSLNSSAAPAQPTGSSFLPKGHLPKSQSFNSIMNIPVTSMIMAEEEEVLAPSFSSDFLPSKGPPTPSSLRRHGRGKSLSSCDSRREAIYDTTTQLSDPLKDIPTKWITFDSFSTLIGEAQAQSSPIRRPKSMAANPDPSLRSQSSFLDALPCHNRVDNKHDASCRSPRSRSALTPPASLKVTKAQTRNKRHSRSSEKHSVDLGHVVVPNVPVIPAIYLPVTSKTKEFVAGCQPRSSTAEAALEYHPIVKKLMLDLDHAIEEWALASPRD